MAKPSASKNQAFFVTGSDEAGLKKRALALSEEIAPGADEFGLDLIDGNVDAVEIAERRIQETIGALITLPFMGGKKLIWLKNISFLADTVLGRSETVTTALERLCDVLEEGLPEGISFLASAVAVDARRTAYKRLCKLCQVESIDLPDMGGFGDKEEKIVAWVGEQARARNLRLSGVAIEILAARVGLNPMQLSSELDKLEAACGLGKNISPEDIRLLVPQTRNGSIFDLSEAILQRDLSLALESLAQLINQREKGVGIIIAAIAPPMRNLLLVKDLMVRHRMASPSHAGRFADALARLPSSETAHLPRKKDASGAINAYPLGLAAVQAGKFSLDELQRGFSATARALQDLIYATAADEVILDRLLLGLLSRQ